MPINDEQVATLRAHLAGDYDEYQRLWGRLDRTAARATYAALVEGAFFEAVDHRFRGEAAPEAARAYVDEVRSRLSEADEAIDPVVAERLLRAVLGNGSIADIDEKRRFGTEVILLSALIIDEQFDDAALNEFMVKARALGDRLLAG
ncbi:hypothetical protein [Actinopolymorpha pittospori]|uniref:Uncharacterized protein n=1 Tax=Actinopolymorpha pittospori TaxID=648752 RepID=A0A927MWE3_9ACTN|nr:hypothetical protein [Actinopolymorpha pittospori]MBE1605998.1 hypothetical protein [Actinopolymorpha pittospori]